MTDWEKIVARHSGIVWQTAYRLLGDHADASDCFQDTFVAALVVSRRQYVRNWAGLLRKLATCKALDRLRSRIRHAAHNSETPDWVAVASQNPGPAQQAAATELSERLRLALAALPDGQAEVFALRYVSDLKYREIARLLGLNTSAVGVLLHRARLGLQKLLLPDHVEKDVEV